MTKAENEKSKKNKEKGKSKGKLIGLIFIIIIILIIATLFSLIKFDVLGIGTKLSPTLSSVPVIKNILPAQEDTSSNMTKEELSTLNQSLEEANLSYVEIIDSLNKEIEELNSEIARLRELEDEQLQFKADKEEFDRLIALNDPSAYTAFYESISPENAEVLYQEAVAQNELSQEFKTYAQTFENMKKDAAASVLE